MQLWRAPKRCALYFFSQNKIIIFIKTICMKQQLQNQQAIKHMLNVAKSQAKSTIVKTPQPKTPPTPQPKKEEPKVEPKVELKIEEELKVEDTKPTETKFKSEKTLPRLNTK